MTFKQKLMGITMLWLLSAFACQLSTTPTMQPTLIIPTAPTMTAIVDAGIEAEAPSPPEAPPPTNTPLPPAPTVTKKTTPLTTQIATAVPPSPTSVSASPPQYQVVFVAEDDSLNVREDAGIQAEIVMALEPHDAGISLSGSQRQIDDSDWVTISHDDEEGWVNSHYLTEVVAEETFCEHHHETHSTLLEFRQQTRQRSSQDGLTSMVNPQRGLRVRTSWWNPEVHLFNTKRIFAATDRYNWGGDPAGGQDGEIEGTFAEVIFPLFVNDLDNATEMGCNEILHGNTAGTIQLPPEYEGINYFSLYRPAPEDGIEFDWGTWVVGIERWQGEYFVSFLVHYGWEI